MIRNLDDCEGRNLMLILVTPPIYASSKELTMLKRETRRQTLTSPYSEVEECSGTTDSQTASSEVSAYTVKNPERIKKETSDRHSDEIFTNLVASGHSIK